MENGEDWILRPVIEGMCSYESLIDCKVDLEDIALMNEVLDIRAENEKRWQKYREKHKD